MSDSMMEDRVMILEIELSRLEFEINQKTYTEKNYVKSIK